MSEAFYVVDGDGFRATVLTRGPWDERFQHGGPPAALVAGAIERWGEDAADFFVTRVTIELLRPVPLATVVVEVEPVRLGRTVQRFRASLHVAGEVVLTATAIRIRRRPVAIPEISLPMTPWPAPETLPPLSFPFFINDVGYHKAVDLFIAEGVWGQTPIRVWGRPRVPLVGGRDSSPLERVMILADAQSGIGIAVPPKEYTFLNPDLTVYFERAVRTEWIGFDVRSTAYDDGIGLAQSEIRDQEGIIGRSAQSLVIAAR